MTAADRLCRSESKTRASLGIRSRSRSMRATRTIRNEFKARIIVAADESPLKRRQEMISMEAVMPRFSLDDERQVDGG